MPGNEKLPIVFDPDTGQGSAIPKRQRLNRAVSGLIGYDERSVPILTRLDNNPIFKQSAQNPAAGVSNPTASSIYWPYIVNAAVAVRNPIDNFYMYYSTDHDSGAGGIWLATAPSPTGPWTGRGRVYQDTVSGTQTETPSVIWNDDESLFFMYYQQGGVSGANGVQTTMLATSPDGLTWTRVGIAVDRPSSSDFPGDGHTGYFRPFRIGRRWFAYHLCGGGNFPHFAFSSSTDGRTWLISPRPLGYGVDQRSDGRRIEWNSGDVFMWRGMPWWVGIVTTFVSGATPKDSRIAIAPLSSNLRHLLGTPMDQLYPVVGSNESVNFRSLHAFVYDGKLLVTYQCDNNFNQAVADL